ncbi:MAG: alpha/beta hydrolase [Eubacteriales bacterium]
MERTQKPRKRAGRYILLALLALIVFLGIAFYAYVNDYRHADETATALLNSASIRQEGNLTILTPDAGNDTGMGFIFYPGGKVEETAYLPLLERLREGGATVVLVKVPLRLAVFDIKAADKVYDAVPGISRWFIGGHSLGGAMASSYVAGNEDKLSGLILLGAYPINDSPISTLCIYGSEDIMLDKTKLEGVANVLRIDGGNHAQFGNYGLQEGDGTATMSREEQQTIASEAMLAFIKGA